MLDLSGFRNAQRSLENALKDLKNESFFNSLTESQQRLVSAGVVQNFEFTYELCWKFIKRWLEFNLGRTEVEGVSRRQLFRLALEHQLIDDVDQWMSFHQARNLTSHTYNESVAEEVIQVAEVFQMHSEKLLSRLEQKND